MTIRELALQAAKVIDKRGFTKRALMDNTGCVCVRGAIFEVLGGHPHSAVSNSDHTLREQLEEQFSHHPKVINRIGTVRNDWGDKFGVVEFNNNRSTTKENVIRILRDIANGF